MKRLKIFLIQIFLISAIFFTNKFALAQDNATNQIAFKNSYLSEFCRDYKKAFETLQNIYDEKSYEINLRMGWLAYLKEEYIESISFYQKAINILPLSVEARFGIIYPATTLQKFGFIKTQYEEIIKLQPNNCNANYNLGYIYYKEENYKEAIKYLEIALNQYPFDYNINCILAMTNYKLGKLTEAKTIFNKVLLIKPNDIYAIVGLSLIDL